MFDPDANIPRINREKAYLTSEIGGRSMNSRRLTRSKIFRQSLLRSNGVK
jgi:hypothetical protein